MKVVDNNGEVLSVSYASIIAIDSAKQDDDKRMRLMDQFIQYGDLPKPKGEGMSLYKKAIEVKIDMKAKVAHLMRERMLSEKNRLKSNYFNVDFGETAKLPYLKLTLIRRLNGEQNSIEGDEANRCYF